MIFTESALPGVWRVDIEPHADERGFFARTWDPVEFADHDLADHISACGTSFNRRKGTVRGMHYQEVPYAEIKFVRCTAGAIFDVAIDLRPDSETYRRWVGMELTAANRTALYIPEGCAHGFQTLEDDSEVMYQIVGPHVPEAARGVRWDDAAFGIEWPLTVSVINRRDATYPDFAETRTQM